MTAKISADNRTFGSESTQPVEMLFKAVSSIKLRLVRLLIEGGIDVDTKNDLHQTPLLAACSSLQKSHFRGETRSEVVKYLISAGANVNVQDNTGRTPLIYAVVTQAHASVIFDLVEAGAELWLEDKSGKCAFNYALQRQDMGQVALIVEAYKRCNSMSFNNPASFRKKLSGIFKQGKNTLSTKRKFSEEKKSPKNQFLQKHKDEHSGNTPYAELQETKSTTSSQHTEHPSMPTISSNVPNEPENHLCNLCKNVIQKGAIPEPSNDSNERNKSEKSTDLLDLDFQEYDLSSLMYRRRSTGSMIGLTEQQCETIKQKNDLGITLEDLFSTPEINHPNFESSESLFVKSSRTNTMVDISAKSLLVPGGNRARSVSVCLPPSDNPITDRRLLPGRAFSFSTGDACDLARKPSAASSYDTTQSPNLRRRKRSMQRFYIGNDGSDDEEDWDDVLVIPASQIDMTSAKNGMVTPDREMTSPEERTLSPGNGFSDCGRSSSRSSPIPTIVLTDSVNESEVDQDK